MTAALLDHLKAGVTTVCQCWAVTRSDGTVLGFTDHDLPLVFGGIAFRADTGLSARAVEGSTGLSVDNSAAVGALSSDAITEADIAAGRYDGAEVRMWQVNWQRPSERRLRFRGTMGEITREGSVFTAELRGQAEALNRPQGRAFLRTCSAVLGDAACGFDTSDPAYSAEVEVVSVTENRSLRLRAPGFNDRWFEQGLLTVLDGGAKGLTGAIKLDAKDDLWRDLTLWSALRAPLAAGDTVRIVAGCDRRAETCRVKFDNMLNFRGFPDIPGEDWLISVPRSGDDGDGGSLTR